MPRGAGGCWRGVDRRTTTRGPPRGPARNPTRERCDGTRTHSECDASTNGCVATGQGGGGGSRLESAVMLSERLRGTPQTAAMEDVSRQRHANGARERKRTPRRGGTHGVPAPIRRSGLSGVFTTATLAAWNSAAKDRMHARSRMLALSSLSLWAADHHTNSLRLSFSRTQTGRRFTASVHSGRSFCGVLNKTSFLFGDVFAHWAT